jgi:hypothetical protein
LDVARHARHIALPEIGPEGQARISAARIAVVGSDLASETATTYLRAAGVTNLSPLPAALSSPLPAVRGEGQGEGSPALNWRALLSNVDLVIRSGFDDDAMSSIVTSLGLPVIYVRATSTEVDLISFSGRAPSPDGPASVPFKAAAPVTDGAAAVLAGTLAAAEALHVIVREASGPFPQKIRHLRLPLDGREPLVQEIGAVAR